MLFTHQQKIINEDPKRTGLWLGTGCLHPDTPIYDPIDKTTLSVKDRTTPFFVWSLSEENELVVARAEAAQAFSPEVFLSFCFSNGASISVTPKHRFWNGQVWITAEELAANFAQKQKSVFAYLPLMLRPKSSFVQLPSTSVLSPQGSLSGVLRLKKKLVDSLTYYQKYFHLCGQLLLQEVSSVLNVFPLPSGVSEHDLHDFGMDGQVYKSANIYYALSQLHSSKQDFFYPASNKISREFLFVPFLNDTKQFLYLILIYALSRTYSFLSYINQLLLLFVQVYFSSSIKTNKTVNILQVDRDETRVTYYDFHVPIYENYLAAGVIHHNSGKTRIALALARGKTLVICPKTQKEDRNWEREVDKMREAGIKVKITHDVMSPTVLPTLKNGHAYPTVISKETFRRDYASTDALGGLYNTIIVDEAETCLGATPNTRQRNKQVIPKTSQLFEALQYAVTTYAPDRVYLCTATITRSPMTVWAAGVLLGKEWDFFNWRNVFYSRLPMPGREVWVPKKSSEVKDRLAAAVRKIGYVGRLEDYFDVPDQTFRNDFVDLTEAQIKRINDIKIEYPDPIVALGKKLQIENGVLNGDEYSPSELITNNKLDKIIRYAEEFPRLIIWCKFSNQIANYADELRKRDFNVHTLTGETKDRDVLFSTLRDSSNYVLIAQAQISAGWELPECPVMVFASRTYSVSDYIQAQGRIQRTNAIKKNLYINLLARGGVDEAVHDSLENKVDFNERVYLNI